MVVTLLALSVAIHWIAGLRTQLSRMKCLVTKELRIKNLSALSCVCAGHCCRSSV